MHKEHLDILRSPITGAALTLKDDTTSNGHVVSGRLCDDEHSWPIIRSIPRFVPDVDGRDSFSIQWREHAKIMHEIHSGYTAYETRFKKETGWPDDLTGEVILEAGCGVGSFTNHALLTGATVASFDLSTSVEQVFRAHGDNKNLLLVQASIYDLPFEKAYFDRVFCFGVIQHTPNPEKSFKSLTDAIKPGGHIATDIYADVPLLWRHHGLLRSKYTLRPYALKMPPDVLHKWIKRYVAVAYPIARTLQRLPGGMPLSQHMMIDDYKTRMVGMKKEYYKEFAIVDILDMLGAAHDNPTTKETFQGWHESSGLESIDVDYGYNGLEGRGVKPKTQ